MIGHCLPPRLLPKALQDLRVQFQRVAAAAFTSKDLCRSAVIEIIHAKYMACTGVDCISWRSMTFLAFYSAPWVPCPSKRYQFLSPNPAFVGQRLIGRERSVSRDRDGQRDRLASRWAISERSVTMSALGQKRTSKLLLRMSALPPRADIGRDGVHVR